MNRPGLIVTVYLNIHTIYNYTRRELMMYFIVGKCNLKIDFYAYDIF